MADEHKVLFEWPYSGPTEVIVAGSFNDWARTCHLTKGPTGFTGSTYVPWGSKITYKYIVDGTWTTHPEQPTEFDHDGNINHMYIAPPQPESKMNSNGKPALAEALDSGTGSIPQLVGYLADTVVAREGTSSTFGYVASGLGAALNSVVDVDPVNAEQIAIPTPLQTAATTAAEFDIPSSAVPDGTPISSAPVEVPSPPRRLVSTNLAASEELKAGPASELPAEVASAISVPIVPVNAAENNTVLILAIEPVTSEEEIRDSSIEKKEQPEKSTHTVVKVSGDVPSINKDITIQAEEIPKIVVGEPRAVIEDTPVTAKILPAEKEESKVLDTVAVTVADETWPLPSADRASKYKEPSSGAPNILETLQATSPSSMLASDDIPTGAALSAFPQGKVLDQEISVVPPQEADKLEQTESESVADNLKIEYSPVLAPEVSLSDVSEGSAVVETAPESVVALESKTEKEESAPVGSVLSAERISTSEAPQKDTERVTEPSVEPVSAIQKEKEAETKPTEPASSPAQTSAPPSQPELTPVPTIEAAPNEFALPSPAKSASTEQLVAPATEAKPSEPTSAPAAEVTQTESLPTLTTNAAPTEPVVASTIQVTPAVLGATSADKSASIEQAPKTEVAPALPIEVVTTTEPSSRLEFEPAVVPPASEPVTAAVAPSNAHVKTAKEVFPSTMSPTASPLKSEKVVPARKKRLSIFGKIKHFFESNKVKSKKS